jgi:DNA-binding NarL/FixJ family response regulator
MDLPLSVVIADDSAVIRERLVALVSEVAGVFVAGETVNVLGTVELVRRLRPAVVVLDLSMPGGSGLDVLRRMREEQLQAVVIVLTNYSFPEYEKEAVQQGASAFLNKSTQFLKVAEILRDLVRQAQAAAVGGEDPGAGAIRSNP